MSKYSELREDLRLEIEEGRCAVGERLCTEAELRQRYGVSANTVIRALRDLEQMGMVTRRRGKGTFVRRRGPDAGAGRAARTLLFNASGSLPRRPDAPMRDVNWFILYELHRGVINSYAGPARLVNDAEMRDAAGAFGPDEAGLVVIDPLPDTREWLRGVKTPWVVVDRRENMARQEVNHVALDRMRGLCEGMFYLIQDLGHRDIAFVTPGDKPHPVRMSGYMIGLHAHGIPFREGLVARTERDGSAEAGYEAVRALLGRGAKFTAVFVDTDTKAAGALRALREAGLRVPEDVSVMGYDDMPGADRMDPPLTTIRSPNFELGVEAVKMLERRFDRGGADVEGVILATRLVVRRSCAPARRADQGAGGSEGLEKEK